MNSHPLMNQHRIRLMRSEADGFTLTELLMVVAIGSVLMLGTASMLISHIQSSARMEGTMRLQEAWSRVQFLLDQEIQEARIQSGSPSSVTCTSLSLTIPNPAGSDGAITYSRSADNILTRSGPVVDQNGRLDFSTQAEGEVVMRGVTSFCPTTSNGRVSYTMALQDASGVTYQNQSNPSGARSRTRVIE